MKYIIAAVLIMLLIVGIIIGIIVFVKSIKSYRQKKQNKRIFQSNLDAATKGNQKAAREVANCYKRGIGVDTDLKAAFLWTKKAAELGDAFSQYLLGSAYLEGNEYVEKNIEQAMLWFTKAADRDDNGARHQLAYMYLFGDGIKQDENKAIELFKQACKNKDAIAALQLGYIYKGNGDMLEARKWFEKAYWEGSNFEMEEAVKQLGYNPSLKGFSNNSSNDPYLQRLHAWATGEDGSDVPHYDVSDM